MPKNKKRRNTEECNIYHNIRKNSFEILFAQRTSTETSEKSNSVQKDATKSGNQKSKDQLKRSRKRTMQVYCMGHLIDYNSNCQMRVTPIDKFAGSIFKQCPNLKEIQNPAWLFDQ